MLNNRQIGWEDIKSQGSVLPALPSKVVCSPTAHLFHICGCNGHCSFSIWVDLEDKEATYQPVHSRQWKSSWEKEKTGKQRNTQHQHGEWQDHRIDVLPMWHLKQTPEKKCLWDRLLENGLRKLWSDEEKVTSIKKTFWFTQKMQTSICDRGNFYMEGQLGLEVSLRLLRAMRRVACNIKRERHIEVV